jgi:hypothetical protein
MLILRHQHPQPDHSQRRRSGDHRLSTRPRYFPRRRLSWRVLIPARSPGTLPLPKISE